IIAVFNLLGQEIPVTVLPDADMLRISITQTGVYIIRLYASQSGKQYTAKVLVELNEAPVPRPRLKPWAGKSLFPDVTNLFSRVPNPRFKPWVGVDDIRQFTEGIKTAFSTPS